jgi:hypothetical protein
MKIVFLNGPPRCGKDFAGQLLLLLDPGIRVDKFARKLKEATHALYGMPELAHDAFEDRKDTPLPEFLALTPRQAYIAVSERYMKPMHGVDVFGRMLLKDLRSAWTGTAVITDSGFAAEAKPLLEWAGPANCTLVRIHREGCTFEGDSRSYIDLPVRTIDIVNPGTKPEFLALLREAV